MHVMQSRSVTETCQGSGAAQLSHTWHLSQERVSGPMDGIYGDLVPVSRDVGFMRFAVLVRRTLTDAHDRGLSDEDIEQMTGVGKSTFHRWQKRQFGASGPQAQKVSAFFNGLGVPVKHAFDALGYGPDDEAPETPEPEIPTEVRELLRQLNDPNVPKREKEFIREHLRMLISRRDRRSGTAKPHR